MKAYIVFRPANSPELFTVERQAKQLVRESSIDSRMEPLVLPDTKAELIPALQELIQRVWSQGVDIGVREEREEAAAKAAAEPPPRSPMGSAGDRCPMCQRTAAGAGKSAQSFDLTRAEELIQSADGWQLRRLFEATIARLAELRAEAERLGRRADRGGEEQ